MNDRPSHDRDSAAAGRYVIRLGGHLDSRWEAWFEGLRLHVEADGTTVLSGSIADQAALHGLLTRVRDLGLPLISVTRIDPQPTHQSPTSEGESA